MNVFEDLVVELKEQNLLEETVIDVAANSRREDEQASDISQAPSTSTQPARAFPVNTGTADRTAPSASEMYGHAESNGASAVSATQQGTPRPPQKPRNGKEFYRKRAVSEVSNLQMVEHVLTGVEREFLKIVPRVFDDLKAKTALHVFVNVDENENSEFHAKAELELMEETESWCTALARRDEGIPVSSLRQYCENSRPALSSQALLALARFYRNLPYSESVRGKFDFVITRLFSRPTDYEKRTCLFSRDDILAHISTLYNDWSSIALYSAEEDESKVLLTALSFDDLAIEAESASSFDQLIESDFFGRLRLFKASINELFYAPNVTAAAIECNIRIGNAYVELVGRERGKMDSESIQSKYEDLNDQEVSDAAARTLALVEILRDHPQDIVTPEPEPVREVPVEKETVEVPAAPAESKFSLPRSISTATAGLRSNAFAINKWFLTFAILIAVGTIGLYTWANFFVDEQVSSSGVASLDIGGTTLVEHVKTARISNGTLYALMLPSWDALPKEKRLEFLQKVYQVARENACTQVNLTTKDGKNAGFASATRMEVTMP